MSPRRLFVLLAYWTCWSFELFYNKNEKKKTSGARGSRCEETPFTPLCCEQGSARRLVRRPSRCVRTVCSSARAALSTRRAAPLERLDGEKGLNGFECGETKFTPFAMNRARGADLSDAVRGACRVCAVLHVWRR